MYPHGISDYMRELSRFLVEPTPLQPVMSAAGLSVARWFRAMLERGPQNEDVCSALSDSVHGPDQP
jgi:hypothetical protein